MPPLHSLAAERQLHLHLHFLLLCPYLLLPSRRRSPLLLIICRLPVRGGSSCLLSALLGRLQLAHLGLLRTGPHPSEYHDQEQDLCLLWLFLSRMIVHRRQGHRTGLEGGVSLRLSKSRLSSKGIRYMPLRNGEHQRPLGLFYESRYCGNASSRVVERRRPVIVLTVFTGDPKHKITVTAFSPQSSLSATDAQSEWDQALRQLRREGARPKETGKGTLMVTSLANFRSDFTIVHIPRGNFVDVREQLYTNINLLRMGCSGRSALTLEEPSDTTKDRFTSMYRIPDKGSARSGAFFNAAVLELVKLIQAALAIFGMFDPSPEERNGLLCDVTCDGIKRWVTEVGELCVRVEPMERVADPTVVAALLSLIFTVRNKLQVLGIVVPKDPFLDPQAFTRALTTFQTSKPHGQTHSHAHHLVHPLSSQNSPPTNPSTSPLSGGAPSLPAAHLNEQLIKSIRSAYDKKMRQNESYKVHRVLINKLDDLAADLRTSADSEDMDTGAASGLNPTADLTAFIKVVVGSSKDAPPSLRYFWTGRPEEVRKKRQEKEAVWSDGEREREGRQREEGEKEGGGKDGRDKDGREREKYQRGRDREKDLKSSDDEGDTKPWSGKVQRKLESWAVIGRTKKLSVDLGTLGKSLLEPSLRGGHSGQSGQSSIVPSVIVSGDPADDDEALSSGQASPVSDGQLPNPLMLGLGPFARAQRSTSEISDYDRRITEFNQKRPSMKVHTQSRIVSWSDPLSARGILGEDNDQEKHRSRASLLSRVDTLANDEDEIEAIMSDIEPAGRRRRATAFGPRRCRSFDAAHDLRGMRTLPIERMCIDVELCGQILVMRRREAHLTNVVACLEALAARLSRSNSRLRQDHDNVRDTLDELRERANVLHQVEAARARADALTQETQALAYESAQFLVDDLWHMAAQPRTRVLALREKAFGTGRRHPQGVRGAHGRFNRVQWTLDGRERIVDVQGRTESEADEEDRLPHARGIDLEEEEEEMDAVEHPTLRPTWVLRFFNYWGSKWGASGSAAKKAKTNEQIEEKSSKKDDKVPESGSSTSIPSSPAPSDAQRRVLTKQPTPS
ncbi:hypothetical protein AcV7_003406 [Taiwanofungus camphoratus]|nr:hypothetical protein AcW2_006200 [Antrodia cinnamomea]KAI0938125.1 hypothetical protein AcV7_003406 [Antrodia cinnamomea]